MLKRNCVERRFLTPTISPFRQYTLNMAACAKTAVRKAP